MFRKFTVFGLVVLLSLGIFSAAFGAPRSLEEIKESGVLRVGVEDETWGVFHIWEGDQLSGFEIDLCNTIAAALGVSAEYTAYDWPPQTHPPTSAACAHCMGLRFMIG